MNARDLMTSDPVTCSIDTSIRDVAEMMRQRNVGDVLVAKEGGVVGIVTDRDIVVRAVADGANPDDLAVGTICSDALVSVGPDAEIDEVISTMEEGALRRIPVLEGERPVGIISLGDLAIKLDSGSVLGRISAAAPN